MYLDDVLYQLGPPLSGRPLFYWWPVDPIGYHTAAALMFRGNPNPPGGLVTTRPGRLLCEDTKDPPGNNCVKAVVGWAI
jgi:hypothetical protein